MKMRLQLEPTRTESGARSSTKYTLFATRLRYVVWRKTHRNRVVNTRT